jgi:carboxypeptidase C (cathepsin A)
VSWVLVLKLVHTVKEEYKHWNIGRFNTAFVVMHYTMKNRILTESTATVEVVFEVDPFLQYQYFEPFKCSIMRFYQQLSERTQHTTTHVSCHTCYKHISLVFLYRVIGLRHTLM